MSQIAKLKRAGRHQEASQVRKLAQQLPSQDPNDPDYRRLRFCRYADDWILGFIGPKSEAEEIKSRIKTFLQAELKLDLSEEKTLITHARTETARFLNYHISTIHENTCRPKHKRHVNGKVELKMPLDVLQKKCHLYMRNGKPRNRPERIHDTAYSIVMQFQAEYRGLVEYYQLADNLHRMTHLKWVMEQSLTKTLARKFQITVPQVYQRYKATLRIGKQPYKVLQVVVPREEKDPLVATWGGIPLKKRPLAILNDQPRPVWNGRTELEQRLLADTCELCGSHDRITVHHIRALKDLDQYGRRESTPMGQNDGGPPPENAHRVLAVPHEYSIWQTPTKHHGQKPCLTGEPYASKGCMYGSGRGGGKGPATGPRSPPTSHAHTTSLQVEIWTQDLPVAYA